MISAGADDAYSREDPGAIAMRPGPSLSGGALTEWTTAEHPSFAGARAEIPLEEVRAVLGDLDFDSFEDVNFGLLTLVLLFTFSRTETPCPKAFTGDGKFDPFPGGLSSDGFPP